MDVSEQFGLSGLVLRIATRPLRKLLAHWLALTLISSLLAGGLLLGRGIGEGAAQGAGRLGADLMVVPQGSDVASGARLLGGVPVGSVLPTGIESRISAMPGVSGVAPQYIFQSSTDSCCEMGNILLVGFDPSRDFTVLPWLRPGTGFSGNNGILAGPLVMKAPGAALRLFNHTFTIAARLEQSGAKTFDSALYIPLDGLAAMERSSRNNGIRLNVPWGKPSILLLRLEPSTEPRQMATALERQYLGIQVLTIAEPLRDNRLLLERLGRGRGPLAAVAWLVALGAGGTFLFSSYRTRRTPLGLLHAFGCGKLLLALMFALETFVLSLAGMVAGSLTALFSLRLSGTYLTMATGVPLLSDWLSLSASAISWCVPVFAGAMGVEAAIIIFLMLRRDSADLLRGAP